MPVTGSVSLSVSAVQTSAFDLATASYSPAMAASLSLIAGASGALAVDRVFADQRTLAASANEDLDLVGSALLDPFGVAVTFAKIKVLVIQALAANTNTVVVGAAATNPWIGVLNAAGTVSLRPGTSFAWFCGPADTTGAATVAATGDLLRVANGGGTTGVDYKIFIIGTVA